MSKYRGIIGECAVAELQSILDTSSSYTDSLFKLGLSTNGGNYARLRRAIREHNLDETKLNANRYKALQYNVQVLQANSKTQALSAILVKNSTYGNSSRLLVRLCREGLKVQQCEKCSLTEWNGTKLTFHLHHNDGDTTNNELNNLKVLCPNCHSQTENFAGKNAKSVRIKGVVVDAYYIKTKSDSVLNSGIDFTKYGWKSKLSSVIDVSPRKISQWLRDYMPDFYVVYCVERAGSVLSVEQLARITVKDVMPADIAKTDAIANSGRTSIKDIEKIKTDIQHSGIDCMKWGWKKDIAAIIGISPQKVNKWLERNMSSFYANNCRVRTKG